LCEDNGPARRTLSANVERVGRMTTTKRYQIVDGPGAVETVDAFKYAYSKSHDFSVTFDLKDESQRQPAASQTTITCTAKVVGLNYESGSDGMFIITMHVSGPGIRGEAKGFYDANRRRGYVDITTYR
jgi:hypothetical protein